MIACMHAEINGKNGSINQPRSNHPCAVVKL
uniref:Uncharacterized protein n=1 Tax=Arundo donax TaxID=35708 RepID=A0A0A9CND2_ARUDO